MAARHLRVVIPGGSGQLGQILARHFHEQGHSVTTISRHSAKHTHVPQPWNALIWDGLEHGYWTEAIDGADVVINLAGRSVNCRYTEANKRAIKNSRVIATGLIGEAIAKAAHPPFLWLNASTCTIYRHALDRPMDEETGEIGGREPDVPRSWDFSIEVASSWERALTAADTPHTRRVAMRAAMVMSPDKGGVFDRLLQLVRFGLGGRAGSGRQFVSWIHEVDFLRSIEFLIDNPDVSGAVNICSPSPVPNTHFMRCLRHAWCSSYIGLPAPLWALNIGAFLAGTEPELLLKSRRVVPGRLRQSGFQFHFPNWRSAAQNLVERWREVNSD